MHLEGKAAVVTGAGRGIGREVAKLLAAQGAAVVVNDPGVGRGGEKTDERPADDVVAEIKKAGGKALANYDSVAEYLKAGLMVKQCVDAFGRIDILVNLAGNLRERMIAKVRRPPESRTGCASLLLSVPTSVKSAATAMAMPTKKG